MSALTDWQAARLAAWEALSEPEKAAARQARAERNQRLVAKRSEEREKARRLFDLHDNGLTAPEIAAALGVSASAVRAFAAARGVVVSRSLSIVRRALRLPLSREAALKRLATDYGTTPHEALTHLLVFMLDEDAAIARRTLHVVRAKVDA